VVYAKQHGATLVEAYPVDSTSGRVPAAQAYMGPMSMFERAGFDLVARQQWRRSSVRPIVRKPL
jgi:hypothetical protein